MRSARVVMSSLLIALAPVSAAAAEGDDEVLTVEADEEIATDEDAEEAEEPREPSDHDGHDGSVGLGFLGARVVASTQPGGPPAVVITPEGDAVLTVEPDEMVVPVFGVRYWFNTTIGVDLGFGFGVEGGSTTQEIPNPDPARHTTLEGSTPSTAAVVGHLAAPISVYSRSHFNVLLIPELQVGYTSGSIEDFEQSTTGEALDLNFSGLMVGFGGRVGLETSFGFIELPELSLQVSWGLRFETRRHKGKIGDAEMKVTDNRFGTSWYDEPWDALAGAVGVFYYF